MRALRALEKQITGVNDSIMLIPSGLCAADHLASLGIASIMDELCDLGGLARASLAH